MKAVCLEDVGRLAVIETEQPTLNGADEVLIRVKQAGICGSEVHAFEGTHPYRKPPAVMGHEVLGTVAAVGAAVSRFKPGDRVTVDPQWPCGECEWCQQGAINLCPNKRVLGTPAWPGGFGEYIVVPERSVFAVPEHLSDIQATMIEPLGVGVHAVNRAGLKPGQSVLILGGGSIGLLTAAMAQVRGAAPIIVADVQQHCLDTAPLLGATHTVRVGQESILDRVMAITDGRGVEVIFLTVGKEELFHAAFDVVRRQGTIVVVALYEAPVTFNPYNIIKKDLHVIGTLMSTEADVREAIDLVASGRVQPQHIVKHQLPMEQAQHGFHLASTKEDGAIKVVLRFD